MPFHDHGRRRALMIAVGVAYAAGAALAQPLTTAATVAWMIPALAALILAWSRTPVGQQPADGRPLRRTAVLWGAVVVVAVALELTAWLQQPAYDVGSAEHPTISLLLDPILEPWPVRFAAWAAWLWLGWRVVRP